MAGLVLKSHYVPTMDRAYLVSRTLPGIRVFGGICLNHYVGGLNVLAAEVAARLGGKVVWLPTADADNERDAFDVLRQEGQRLPPYLEVSRSWRYLPASRITLVDEHGQLRGVVRDVLALAREKELVVATGHVGRTEIWAVAREARAQRFGRLLITHPESRWIQLTTAEQRELAQVPGVFFERCYAYMRSVPPGTPAWEALFRVVRHTGLDRNVLSSDLGQVDGEWPDEGLETFVSRFLAGGFTVAEVQQMTVKVPEYLLEP